MGTSMRGLLRSAPAHGGGGGGDTLAGMLPFFCPAGQAIFPSSRPSAEGGPPGEIRFDPLVPSRLLPGPFQGADVDPVFLALVAADRVEAEAGFGAAERDHLHLLADDLRLER